MSKKAKRKLKIKKKAKKAALKATKKLHKSDKKRLKALEKKLRKAEKKALKECQKLQEAMSKIHGDNVIKLPPRVSEDIKAHAKVKRGQSGPVVAIDPFKPAKPMPGVVPKGKLAKSGFPIAMDEQIIEVSAWGAANVLNGAFQNGAAFVGYPMLSELAQIPEYRKIVESIATHMTRKFIKLQSTAKDDDKSDKIRQLNDALDAFKVRDLMRKACEVDGFFGRAHIYIDTGDGDSREELLLPIGNGRDQMSKEKATNAKSVKGFKVIEPIWTYPANYNANDPLKFDWYNPETWFVQGKEIHRSRLLPIVGREVPDMLKPAYSFGGLSLSQMARPYVDNWLRTRQSVADMIWSFSVSGIKTDLNAYLAPGARQGLFDRIDLFNDLKNNRGLMVMQQGADGSGEEFFQFNTPLGTLDMLQAQAQEQMASVSSIPLVFLLGISPHGLNASSEGEIRAFYDYIHAFQMKLFNDPLTKIIDFIQLKLWGDVDDDISFSFEPLWSLDEKGVAEVQKLRAETDDLLINGAIIDPREARQRVASDPNSEYPDIDVDDLPTPPAEEIGGAALNPGAAKPKPGEEGSNPESDRALAA